MQQVLVSLILLQLFTCTLRDMDRFSIEGGSAPFLGCVHPVENEVVDHTHYRLKQLEMKRIAVT